MGGKGWVAIGEGVGWHDMAWNEMAWHDVVGSWRSEGKGEKRRRGIAHRLGWVGGRWQMEPRWQVEDGMSGLDGSGMRGWGGRRMGPGQDRTWRGTSASWLCRSGSG